MKPRRAGVDDEPSAIAVQLDLVEPVPALGQLDDARGQHWRGEGGGALGRIQRCPPGAPEIDGQLGVRQ